MNSVPMPSVVTTEKLAMSEGVKANNANATFAAPSENRRRVANQSARPRKTPSSVFMGRVRAAMSSGSGCIESMR